MSYDIEQSMDDLVMAGRIIEKYENKPLTAPRPAEEYNYLYHAYKSMDEAKTTIRSSTK